MAGYPMSIKPGCVCGHHSRECQCTEESPVDKHERIYSRAESAAKKEEAQNKVKMTPEEFELAVQAYYQAFSANEKADEIVRDMEKFAFGVRKKD